LRIHRLDHDTGGTVTDQLWHSPNRGHDSGNALRHSFDYRFREAFAILGCHHNNVCHARESYGIFSKTGAVNA